jgi:phosphohistidine phosphatase SixA
MRRFLSLKSRTLLVAGLLWTLSMPGGLLAGQLVGDTAPKLQGQELINALKQGGYVIYFRHGLTGKTGETDVAAQDLSNCAIQRNLSEEGQAQTKAIGAGVAKHQISVGAIYSSPYCRAMDTAKNIFGKEVEKSDVLHFAIHVDKAGRAELSAKLRDMLATLPQAGTNTALVSHTANLKEAVDIWPKPEGVAHVFKPEGNGNFSYVGMLLPEEWSM